jgi:adenylate cyclase
MAVPDGIRPASLLEQRALNEYELVNSDGFAPIRPTAGRWAVVGRTTAAEFSVAHPSMSRRHAELRLTDRGVELLDLGSTNGTFVNDKALDPSTITRVAPGDDVAFGDVHYSVEALQPPEESILLSAATMESAKVQQTILAQMPLGVLDESHATSMSPATVSDPASQPGHRLTLLLEIAKHLSKQQPVEELLDKIVDITTEVMKVHRVSILILDDASEELVPKVSRHVGKGSIGSSHLPQSILRKVVQEKVAVLTENALDDDRFDGRSVILQNVCAAMCAPLLSQIGEVIGAIYVDNLSLVATYSEQDLDFLTSFAGVAGVAIENSRLSERTREQAVSLSNFERYFAPGLAEQISGETGGIELGGQRREIAVLFTDIRGFTQISEQVTPEQLAQLLNDYFTEMVDIIFDYGGTLDKFIGDAILANWGAPISRPDDADRALLAAIEMQKELAKMNETRQAEQPLIQMGVGINFGEAFVGNIGSHRRLEYTAIGDVVNVASRLCSIAGPGEIMVSEPFMQALSYRPPCEAKEPVHLKGKAEATNVHKVIW